MNIAIIGANGQIGKILTQKLVNTGEHQVTAVIRKPEQATAFEQMGAKTAIGNLEGTVDELAQVIQGADAVVFAAGSGGSTGDDKTLLIDLDGAVKSMEAAEQFGIKRFVLISAMFAYNRSKWSDSIKPYYVAKHYADRMLEASTLDYTIIRPGGLLNDEGTGQIEIGEQLSEGGSIPREDVAEVIVYVLDQQHTYRKGYDVISGKQSIAEAVQSLSN
ncbi:SDR family oxidoreductase [Paenibacillus bovis]|uniref:Sugar epimerase n=1 Tax=Paenibacillus bovis TaxID=1616788 RepID=A0A172ZIV3_9BACL|nr:SDR family oxidoreductase [Paenibacillus bovis]ANF97561.1 sugar epimerase [Paenibacillus bovis]